MSAEARTARLAELDGEILALQRQEEAVITRLTASGSFLPRRRFADPRAVLMVEVVSRPESGRFAAEDGTSEEVSEVAAQATE